VTAAPPRRSLKDVKVALFSIIVGEAILHVTFMILLIEHLSVKLKWGSETKNLLCDFGGFCFRGNVNG
jgi:hypothetical protein